MSAAAAKARRASHGREERARAVGRPLGDFARAVLGAVVHLETVTQAPTVREIGEHLNCTHVRQINARELHSTIESLKACDKLEVKRMRKVDYCTKPVCELGLAVTDAPSDVTEWHAAMSMWMGGR